MHTTPGTAAAWEWQAPGVARRRLPFLDVTVGVVVGGERVLVIDTGSTLREGTDLRREIEALADGRRVTDIALSHGHFDHVFGAAAFPGARVHGARGLDGCLARERGALRDEAVEYGVDPAEAAAAARALVRPVHLVDGCTRLDLGGGHEVLLVRPGEGHTGHDLAVVVPAGAGAGGSEGAGAGAAGAAGAGSGAPAVVFCGDLVEESGPPQAGPDAVPARWPAALDHLLAMGGPGARYVPGHGEMVDAAFVRRQRDELAARFGLA